MIQKFNHIPVLLKESIEGLNINPFSIFSAIAKFTNSAIGRCLRSDKCILFISYYQ